MKLKKDRLELQQAQIDRAIEDGYKLEDYKGLKILTNESDLHLKIFKGTAANHLCYYRYRNLEQMAEAVQRYKDSQDRQIEYKEEAKKDKTKSTAANCAGAAKAELNKAFPNIKFSVKSDNYSMGNSVRVGWTDGPTVKMVDDIVQKYQYGNFDGMTDMYEYSNRRDDIPQTKYMQTSRTMSDEARAILLPFAEELYKKEAYSSHDPGHWLYQVFYASPITGEILGIKRNEKTSGSARPQEFYYIECKSNQVIKPKKEEIEEGKVKIINYSEKALAVIGDTYPIKDKLRSLGGRFNRRLTCGAGWVFPKSKLDELKAEFSKPDFKEDKAEKVEQELKEEVKKTIEFLAEVDIKNTGEISEGTREAAKVQQIALPPHKENSLYLVKDEETKPEIIKPEQLALFLYNC